MANILGTEDDIWSKLTSEEKIKLGTELFKILQEEINKEVIFMKCPRCKIEVDMTLGFGIDYEYKYFGVFSQALLNKDTLTLIDVLKCPKCGHSENLSSTNKNEV